MNGAVTNPSPLWMRMVFGRNPKRTLIRLVCLVVLTLVVFPLVLIPIQVSGLSMYPTYRDGKVNFVNRLAYRWKAPQRGDVVAFRLLPENMVILKRIVGLPGERVKVFRGRVSINGEILQEPYANINTKTANPVSRENVVLDKDEYFVIGDNRNNTFSATVRLRDLLGKVLF